MFNLCSIAVVEVQMVLSCKFDCIMAVLNCIYVHVVCWIMLE